MPKGNPAGYFKKNKKKGKYSDEVFNRRLNGKKNEEKKDEEKK